MSRKKVFLLLVSLVFMSLFSNVVFASNHPDGVGAGLGDAFDTIRELFAFLPELVTLEKLIGGTDEAAKFWARFLVWVLLFAVFFFGASKVFPDNKRIAVIVSLVIALMGTLLIPYSILVNIFQTYGLVAGIIVWTIPLIAGMFIAHKLENPFARAVIYGVSAWILFSINETVVKEQGFANTNFPFFGLLLAVVIIMFVVNVAQIFGAIGGAGGAVGGWAADRGRDFSDWVTGRDRERTEERRERGHEREVDDAEDLNRRLEVLEEELQNELRIRGRNEIERLQELARLLRELVEVQEQLNAARRFR